MFRPLFLAALLLLPFASARAEEKNGLLVTVSKKTLDRNDIRNNSYYYSDRIDRTQGLKLTIKNTSFKEQPAGEVEWTILVRKYASNSVEGYRGKEALKALKPAEQIEMVIGAAAITGWSNTSAQVKDKPEHQIIVKQGGQEAIRLTSTGSFDIMAKRATFSSPAH